ncbi:ATP-dependent endonuclease [Cellulomonas sp. JH27-2]|uniref:TOPRIM nucleotidyl transferase/hydrolase domain-containing protein n=1 Tax=Cellulomonas sp. JH27-2 TaxID=2774139 RepID=UPI00177EB30E|nr:ATP-dependent endonuclease [Cellulomonas sp. JH27-2]
MPELGPDAPQRATARALDRLPGAAAVVLVEGISDEQAVLAAADGLGRDLVDEHVVVVPVGGAHAVDRTLGIVAATVPDGRVAGLYDVAEEPVVRRALIRRGLVGPLEDLSSAGFHVCRLDLEDELIRALGARSVIDVVERAGDGNALRTLQDQQAWRDQPVEAQLRRFLGSGASRKIRYGRLLVQEAATRGVLPAPLAGVLDAVRDR